MPKKTKKDDGLFEILLKGLFDAIKWTVVYYVGAWTALLGVVGVITYIDKRRKAKK